MPSIQLGLWAKTFPESCPLKMPSGASLESWLAHPGRSAPDVKTDDGRTRVWWLDPGAPSRSESSTRRNMAFPNGEDGCFSWPSRFPTLRLLLEKLQIPPRYFLSPLACSGILRRAVKRGKKLSALLEAALRQGADMETAKNRK